MGASQAYSADVGRTLPARGSINQGQDRRAVLRPFARDAIEFGLTVITQNKPRSRRGLRAACGAMASHSSSLWEGAPASHNRRVIGYARQMATNQKRSTVVLHRNSVCSYMQTALSTDSGHSDTIVW